MRIHLHTLTRPRPMLIQGITKMRQIRIDPATDVPEKIEPISPLEIRAAQQRMELQGKITWQILADDPIIRREVRKVPLPIEPAGGRVSISSFTLSLRFGPPR